MKPHLQFLNSNYIEKNSKLPENSIKIFNKINSTNKYLKKIPYYEFPIICIAEHQTDGKGRHEKNWYSPFAQNIYLSCRYMFSNNMNNLIGLSIISSLAIIESLNKFNLPHPAMVKWPNDIVVEGKKLAGTLVEIQQITNNFFSAIIGIGINVNMTTAKKNNIPQNWTSLRKIMERDIDRNDICISLIIVLFEYLKKFSFEKLPGFYNQWKKTDYLFGKKININTLQNKNLFYGTAIGINYLGQMLIELPNGQIKKISSGSLFLCENKKNWVINNKYFYKS